MTAGEVLMGIVDDLLKALDRIPLWKRLGQVPGEIDGLRGRVDALEEQLGGVWPGDICKYCGARAVRLHWDAPDGKGNIQQDWHCSACNRTETRLIKPSSR